MAVGFERASQPPCNIGAQGGWRYHLDRVSAFQQQIAQRNRRCDGGFQHEAADHIGDHLVFRELQFPERADEATLLAHAQDQLHGWFGEKLESPFFSDVCIERKCRVACQHGVACRHGVNPVHAQQVPLGAAFGARAVGHQIQHRAFFHQRQWQNGELPGLKVDVRPF